MGKIFAVLSKIFFWGDHDPFGGIQPQQLQRTYMTEDDKARIDEMIDELKDAWLRTPNLRLGQLIVNIVNPQQPCPEIFYVEDYKLYKKIGEW